MAELRIHCLEFLPLSTGAENRLRPEPRGRGAAAGPSLQPGGTDPKVAGVRQGALLLQLARAPQADQENQVCVCERERVLVVTPLNQPND